MVFCIEGMIHVHSDGCYFDQLLTRHVNDWSRSVRGVKPGNHSHTPGRLALVDEHIHKAFRHLTAHQQGSMIVVVGPFRVIDGP